MIKLYKYRAFSTEEQKNWVRDIIENQRVYCSTPDKLNDPYDCNIGTADHLFGYLSNTGIFSLCGPEHDEILQFSYYADSHRGICFEFEIDTDRTIAESSFLAFAQPIDYVKVFPPFNPDTIHRLPWTKYEAWKRENEYRVSANLDHDPSPYRGFRKEELIGIRFGLKMQLEDQQLVIQWAEEANYPNLKFWKTTPRTDKFRLMYKPL